MKILQPYSLFKVVFCSVLGIGALVIEAGGSTSILDFNSGTTLNVSGGITIGGGTGNGDDKRIDVGDGILTCASITMLTTGNDGADSEVRIDDGTVTVSGDITMNDVATRNFIEFTNPGTLNVGGSISAGGGSEECGYETNHCQ